MRKKLQLQTDLLIFRGKLDGPEERTGGMDQKTAVSAATTASLPATARVIR